LLPETQIERRFKSSVRAHYGVSASFGRLTVRPAGCETRRPSTPLLESGDTVNLMTWLSTYETRAESELRAWRYWLGSSAKGLVRPVVVEAMREGIDELLEAVGAACQVEECVELVTP